MIINCPWGDKSYLLKSIRHKPAIRRDFPGNDRQMQGKFDLLISDGEKLISSLLTAPCVFPNDPSHVYTVFDGASLNTRYILYLVLKVNIFVCVDVVSTRFIIVCVHCTIHVVDVAASDAEQSGELLH